MEEKEMEKENAGYIPEIPQKKQSIFADEIRLYDTENYIRPERSVLANGRDTSFNWRVIGAIAFGIFVLLCFLRVLYGGIPAKNVDYLYPVGTDMMDIIYVLDEEGITYHCAENGGRVYVVVNKKMDHNVYGRTRMEIIYVFDQNRHLEGEKIATRYNTDKVSDGEIMRHYRNSVATLRKLYGKPRYCDTLSANEKDPLLKKVKDTLEGNIEEPMFLTVWPIMQGEVSICRYLDQLIIEAGTDPVYMNYLQDNEIL